MSDLLTHIERPELVDVDLDEEPQCEGREHGLSSTYHDAGSARYSVLFPCDGHSVLACDRRARAFRTFRTLCRKGHEHYPDELRFIEL